MTSNATRIALGAALAWTVFFCLPAAPAWGAETIRMRVVVVNPSSEKTQTKTIKSYLPKEITLKDVRDSGGLDLDYDEEQGLLFVHKADVELAPGESKTFEVVLDDVWVVPPDRIDRHRAHADQILMLLKDTPYYESAEIVVEAIRSRLEEVTRTQNDQTVTRQQHIAYHRNNVKILESIEQDLERLEKLVAKAGGPPNLEMIEKSDVNLKSPTAKTTWIIIMIILIFIAILGATFYFTWIGQAKITENIFSREKDATFSDFKPEGGAGKPEP